MDNNKTALEEHLNKMKVHLDNLITRVKQKLLDKERPLGTKPAASNAEVPILDLSLRNQRRDRTHSLGT